MAQSNSCGFSELVEDFLLSFCLLLPGNVNRNGVIAVLIHNTSSVLENPIAQILGVPQVAGSLLWNTSCEV